MKNGIVQLSCIFEPTVILTKLIMVRNVSIFHIVLDNIFCVQNLIKIITALYAFASCCDYSKRNVYCRRPGPCHLLN